MESDSVAEAFSRHAGIPDEKDIKKLEKEIGNAFASIGKVKEEIESQLTVKLAVAVLEESLKFAEIAAPDNWRLQIGPVTFQMHGFDKDVKQHTQKLIDDLKSHHVGMANAIRPFILAAKPKAVYIQLQVSVPGVQSLGGGITVGYDDPVKRIDHILEVIKKLPFPVVI